MSHDKQLRNHALKAMWLAVFISMLVTASGLTGYAQQQQFTFMGDYDKSFAAPLGYYVDAEEVDPTINEYQTYFTSGALLPDGSIIAGGRHVGDNGQFGNNGDFYLRKFTPSGAVDTSFGTNGFVRTNFHFRHDGAFGTDLPQVLKVQPDGKILFAGNCITLEPGQFPAAAFGSDACVLRYNANGTLDQSFGGFPVTYSNGTSSTTTQIDPGKVIFQTGIISSSGQSFGTGGTYYDMAIQPDGKIVLVGETRNWTNTFAAQGFGAIIVRLNPNGTLDATFGSGGIARWNAPEGPANCFPPRGFMGVRLQPDGRIIAVGFDSRSVCSGASATGNRFTVTRWTASGQLETVRHLDNITAFDFQDERAVAVHLTRDAGKLVVSGSYRNLSGTPAGRQKPTIVRFNLADLSLDTSFGSGGIAQYDRVGDSSVPSTVYIKAIQPDGRLIGTDTTLSGANDIVIRFNPNGSPDLSFGNLGIDGLPGRGRARVNVLHYNGVSSQLNIGQILLRPNGRINLIGYSAAHTGLGILRAAISQQNTVWKNGIYSDFENDGRANFSVFRDGAWYWLNSSTNAFNGAQFGTAGDKIAPADYDGDGRTDLAVFRNGAWYILRSSDSQFYGVSFGASGDLPRPGDFDGDGRADVAVFRPSTGTWYMLRSSDGGFGATQFGASGDAPLLADFDADGRTDISVFRNGTWYWLRSSDGGFDYTQFGQSGDIPVVGDYDADSRFDPAVFRPSNGSWYAQRSQLGFMAVQFGQNGDVPVPGDYDNDGKHDVAVYRAGGWYLLRSSDGQFVGVSFGINLDMPVQAAYLP